MLRATNAQAGIASDGLENFRVSLHALYQTFWNPWIPYIIDIYIYWTKIFNHYGFFQQISASMIKNYCFSYASYDKKCLKNLPEFSI